MNGWTDISAAAAAPVAANAAALADAAAQQGTWLFDLLRRNAGTAYGRTHRFSSVRNAVDYARQVPIVRHEDLTEEIDAIGDGAGNLLTAEPIVAFEETSGTTAGRKLIPYTRSGLRDFESAVLVWLQNLAAARPSITAGKAYWSISPAGRSARHTGGGIPIGFPSDAGYFSDTTGAALASVSAVPFAAGQLCDMETWRFFTLRSLLACEELSFISVWSPSFLSLLLDAIPPLAESLMAAIHDGTPGCDLPPNLMPDLQPQPDRARYLAQALRSPNPPRLWPRLALVSAWSHGAARAPFDSLCRRMPDMAFDGKGLMATEGVISISDPRCAHPPPALASTFIEFVDAKGCSHLAPELEPGGRYRIVMTTRSGLYRYDLGDDVACRAIAGGVPELEFLGRSGVVSDMAGEKLEESFVASCLGLVGDGSILAPLDRPHCRYLLLHTANLPAADIAGLEHRLRANPHYAYARRLGQLGPIATHRYGDLKAAYHRFRLHQGQRLGDIKPPVLLRNPAETSAFLSFLKIDGEFVRQPESAARRMA